MTTTDFPKPRFLCDVDGVLADFLGGALPVIAEVTGTPYRVEDFPKWDLFDVVPEEHEDACYDAFKRPGFCAGLAPYPGTVEGVEALRALVDLRIVTSPMHGPHWHFERLGWLDRHVGIPERHVTFTSEKSFVHGDFLLDDRPSHVEKWALRHPDGLALLWHLHCNASDDTPERVSNVRRVRGWGEVVAAVKAHGR